MWNMLCCLWSGGKCCCCDWWKYPRPSYGPRRLHISWFYTYSYHVGWGKNSHQFIWSSQTTHRLVLHLQLPRWMGEEFTSVRGETLARCGTSVGQNRSLRNCTLKTIWSMEDVMVVIRYVAEGREVGVESDYKGDYGFCGIIDGFQFQGRGSGNRTGSVDGLLYFLSAVSTWN